MASYTEHISQAKNNLAFLHEINKGINGTYWDWKVTVSFYVGVHLVNSHIAAKTNCHYRKHEEVDKAISPFTTLSLSKMPEDVYTSYRHLQNLSRRSRYLISEKMDNRTDAGQLTYDKHFKRALTHLDRLMEFIKETYSEGFTKTIVNCQIARSSQFEHFNVL